MKRLALFLIILLQFLRLATPVLAFDAGMETSVDLSTAFTLVNQGLRAQLHPVKTLLDVSARMADTSTPSKPDRKLPVQHPSDTALLISPSIEMSKTHTPWTPHAVALLVMLLAALCAGMNVCRAGVVRCRIQHLFTRAREGIADAALPRVVFAHTYNLR